MFRIRLRLNNPPRSLSPDQFAADQQLRTGDRIGLKERSVDCLQIQLSVQRSAFGAAFSSAFEPGAESANAEAIYQACSSTAQGNACQPRFGEASSC